MSDGPQENPASGPVPAGVPDLPRETAAPLVTIRGLSKRYKNLDALKDLNLDIRPGDLYGFIGPNGAGKTTTMRILATLLRPNTGVVSVAGYDLRTQPDEIRRVIGYMPDFFGVYDDLTVQEYLEFFAACYGIHEHRKRVVDNVLQITDLTGKRDDLIDALSRGMQQRLGLARVLVHDPPFLILDEPASGLDPRARIEFREILLELQRMGKTILISSHILKELAEICNRVAILEKGKLLYDGPVDAAAEDLSGAREFLVAVFGAPESAVALLQELPEVDTAKARADGMIHVRTKTGSADTDLASQLIARGLRLRHYEACRADLEDVFLHVTKGEVQ